MAPTTSTTGSSEVSPDESNKTHPLIAVAIVMSALLVFWADVSSALGVAVWVFFIVPVTLSIWAGRAFVPVAVAVACTGLIILGIFFSPPPAGGVASWVPRVNRSFGILVVWVLGLVARELIRGRLQLAERTWVREGVSRLTVGLQGELTAEQLADNVLRILCEHLGAAVGVLYIREADGFARAGGYALPPAYAPPARIAAGEGLVGQAVKDGRALELREMPADYLPVSSALGTARPQELMIVPTTVQADVNGAIELGFMRAIEPRHRDLLDAIAEPVAIAIRSHHYRARLQQLLEETQQLAEELQTQQEELRASNEQLEEQSRMLMESQARLEGQQAELEATNTQLEEQAANLEHQRDEIARSEALISEKADELERTNQYKSEFLANMSHELRTPLNSALILSKLLADNSKGNLTEEQVKHAETIYSSGNDLLTLINDILDLSRIEAGRVSVTPEETELERIVDPLVRTFQPVAAEKGLAFHALVDPDAPEKLTTDPLRLQQILRNLLANAFKFTEQGEVELRISAAPAGGKEPAEAIRFSVRDTGIGIPKEQQAAIFEAFRQADGTTQRKYGGTGLGLTISRQLARRLGGDISLESNPGEGATFHLVVPTRLAAEAGGATAPSAAAPAPAAAEALAEPAAGARPARASPRSRKAAPTPASGTRDAGQAAVEDDRERLVPGRRALLIIEDDLRFAEILRELARERGYLCLVASNAAEGIELAERHRPSAVLLDVNLPDSSGLTVLEQLKRRPALRHLPVHVMSVEDHTQRALEMGAIGYAVKPVRREQLLEAFGKLEEKLEQRIRRVLVVEDSARQRESLIQLLGAEDVEVVTAESGRAALELLERTSFDCVVLDLKLPDMSGYDLLDRMAADEAVSFPPVIVYTGRALTRDEEQRLRRHARSIVIKGARSPERLLDEVTLFLHQVESRLPPEQQRVLKEVRSRDATLEGRRVLIVEDDVRNVFALTSVFEPRGAAVVIARNGREALEILDAAAGRPAESIDLVLMDVMMPEMDGLTATREIRKRAPWKKLPIIVLTAKAMPDDRERCIEAGANDYIAKPLDVDKLLSLVRVWMPK
jgi:CheY-like chemotaxis protein/signal transduction histidine kinase